MAAKLARLFVTTFQASITNPPRRLGLSGPDALSHMHCRASARLGVSASGPTRANDSMGYGPGARSANKPDRAMLLGHGRHNGAQSPHGTDASEAKGQSGCREEC